MRDKPPTDKIEIRRKVLEVFNTANRKEFVEWVMIQTSNNETLELKLAMITKLFLIMLDEFFEITPALAQKEYEYHSSDLNLSVIEAEQEAIELVDDITGENSDGGTPLLCQHLRIMDLFPVMQNAIKYDFQSIPELLERHKAWRLAGLKDYVSGIDNDIGYVDTPAIILFVNCVNFLISKKLVNKIDIFRSNSKQP